ncbi:hypothetical protein [Enhydrobacter sp.]|jgi:hypothetical protein|uniref:hypothetical protein n=1 Tax=Enhydrobacter sp. TaxID=1894999 RepID=UPI0026229A97|nr:hypothetical protein [Enhydrobacter sp.]
MSFPRLRFLILPVAFGLPLLTGACAAPLALTAAGYGADGVSLAETDKTMADHFVSMVSKQDCAMWRMFRDQDVCRPRDGDHDPYDVNYSEPFRQPGEAGVEYSPPLRAAADAPPTSWNPQAYAKPNTEAAPAASSVTLAEQTPSPSAVARPSPAEKPAVEHAAAKRKRVTKKRAPGRAATDP